MVELKPLSEQVIVITGASSGIGLATARRAAAAGAKVVLIGRDAGTLAPIVEEIEAAGGSAVYALADVGEREALSRAADRAIDAFGRIDTWVSNAGVAIYSDLILTPREEHERLFRTNYWGMVNSAEVAVPYLRKSGGALIVVGSIASDMGSPVMGAYAASKHAVKGYVDSLRIELVRDGVPVVATLVRPSGIDTPLRAHVANHKTGEARIPPPLHSPALVARTILHAAAHPVREVTVGGAGLAQVLFATHLPTAFTRIAGAITPLLNNPRRPKTPGSNLFDAGIGGKTTGDGAPGLPFSLYTTLRLRPVAAAIALLGVTGAIVITAGRVRRAVT